MLKTPGSKVELVKTSVRLPPETLANLKSTAKLHGRTMNAEVLARVSESEDRATFRQLIKQNDELRALMREMLDRLDMLK